MSGIRAPDGKRLTLVQIDVLGIAVDRGMVDYYQAAEAGGQGATLSSLVKKGLLAKYTFANGDHWLPTDAARATLKGSGPNLADANSNQAPTP